MEASFILENFLVSRSGLTSIISFEQFQKEFPSDVPLHTLREVYDALAEQRESTVLEPMKERVGREFNVPLDASQHKAGDVGVMPVTRVSLKELTENLEEVGNGVNVTNDILDAEIADQIQSIRSIIDELNDLRYGKSWTRGGSASDVTSAVKDAIHAIDKCDRLFTQ